jgi:hypothetical protein
MVVVLLLLPGIGEPLFSARMLGIHLLLKLTMLRAVVTIAVTFPPPLGPGTNQTHEGEAVSTHIHCALASHGMS